MTIDFFQEQSIKKIFSPCTKDGALGSAFGGRHSRVCFVSHHVNDVVDCVAWVMDLILNSLRQSA